MEVCPTSTQMDIKKKGPRKRRKGEEGGKKPLDLRQLILERVFLLKGQLIPVPSLTHLKERETHRVTDRV